MLSELSDDRKKDCISHGVVLLVGAVLGNLFRSDPSCGFSSCSNIIAYVYKMWLGCQPLRRRDSREATAATTPRIGVTSV